MTRHMIRHFSAAMLVLALGACEASNPFTTAGSLRVDVEVYKGPLSKEPTLQWAELIAIIQQSQESLNGIFKASMIVMDKETVDCSKISKATIFSEFCR